MLECLISNRRPRWICLSKDVAPWESWVCPDVGYPKISNAQRHHFLVDFKVLQNERIKFFLDSLFFNQMWQWKITYKCRLWWENYRIINELFPVATFDYRRLFKGHIFFALPAFLAVRSSTACTNWTWSSCILVIILGCASHLTSSL